MVAKLPVGAHGATLLAATVIAATVIATGARASEAVTLADRAGFLIGHAQRCGVAENRLERSAKRVGTIIAAFAADDGDREAAQTRFADGIAAAALTQLLGSTLPSCAIVRSTLAQFEQHRQPAEHREGQMARNDRHNGGTARRAASAGPAPGKTARRTSSQREELTAERRAELEMRRVAQQTRGKPPSI